MKFSDLYHSRKPVFSLEFFPPQTDQDLPKTQDLIRWLGDAGADFMTVTYGAGGGTRTRTRSLTQFIVNDLKRLAVAHLTCVGHSVSEIDLILDELAASGVKHIVALRGDPPKGSKEFVPHPDGFSCARDLTSHIAKRGGFSIAVAGYPEVHPEAKSPQIDIDYLKEKVDAGAELIITQLFFDSRFYFDFLEKTQAVGIKVPVVPGIMPVSNVKQLERFTRMCGASIPPKMLSELKEVERDSETVKLFGTRFATNLGIELLEGAAPGLHFYTLNKHAQVEVIIERIKNHFGSRLQESIAG